MVRHIVLVAFLLTACGEDPAPTVTVEPVVEPAEPASSRDEVPEDTGPRILEVEERTLPAEGDLAALTYEVPRHPNEAVRSALETFLVALARDAQSHGYDESARCSLLLAHTHLTTALCVGGFSVRGGRSMSVKATHFAIAGERVEPFALEQAFLPGADVGADVRSACERENVSCELEPTLALGAESLVGHVVVGSFAPELVELEISYEALRERMLPSGPLAPLLGIESDPDEAAPEELGAWAITPTLLTEEAVARFAAIAPTQSRGVKLEPFGPSLARLVVTSGGNERASSLAASLGSEARALTRVDSEALIALSWARTKDQLGVFVDARQQTILPVGALVVVMGELPRGQWEGAQIYSGLRSGRVEADDLEPHTGCVPAPPASFGEPAPSLVALTRAHVQGRARDVVLFARTNEDETRIAVHDLRARTCAVGEERGSFTTTGELFDLQLQSASERRGPTLIVAGSAGEDGNRHYVIRELGRSENAWEHDFDPAPGVGYMVWLGFTWSSGWLPVSYQPTSEGFHGLQWENGTLVEAGAVHQ